MTHHNNHHHHETKNSLSFNKKLVKLLEHWLKHNLDHAETYRRWAKEAEKNDLIQTGTLLNEAAKMTLQINRKLEEAAEVIKSEKV
ncbi:MAG TPA: hypothetical protein ENG35_05445 [Desulfobacteraceae bacterium]|nr:hypothetical protein [Desulfobacteraceae bacterium]